jgi:hypothetical protein
VTYEPMMRERDELDGLVDSDIEALNEMDDELLMAILVATGVCGAILNQKIESDASRRSRVWRNHLSTKHRLGLGLPTQS